MQSYLQRQSEPWGRTYGTSVESLAGPISDLVVKPVALKGLEINLGTPNDMYITAKKNYKYMITQPFINHRSTLKLEHIIYYYFHYYHVIHKVYNSYTCI